MNFDDERRVRGRVPGALSGLAAALTTACLLTLTGCATPDLPAGPVRMPEATTISQAAAAAASAPVAAASAPEVPVVAQVEPVPEPVDPLRPDVRVDLNDRAAQNDLWERVRLRFGMADLDTPLVRSAEQWYSTRPDYVQRMTERGSRYLFHIIEEVDRRGMPSELALLPFIESAFNPQAMSSASASGMWQFMPLTGKDFSLRQNVFRDDRRDVLASTRAALDYLQRLHGMFGDWHLALAAYNWGEGNVAKAIARNQRAGLPTDYLSLRMPNETAYYVPKLQAVKNIVSRPEAFSLSLPKISNHPYFLSVPITRDIDVDIAARLAGVSSDEFKTLNPQMNKPVILAAGTPQLLLPYDNANQFVRKLSTHSGPTATWTAWVAPTTLRPAEAARQVGMSEEALREVNRIPPRMLVKAGSTLLVPRSDQRQADVSTHLADNATMALAPDAPPLRRVAFKAGKRDTVASIAKRYRVPAGQVAQWNHVAAGASFKAGQAVVVYVPTRAAGTRAATRTVAKGGKATHASTRHAATRKAAAGKPSRRAGGSKPTARMARAGGR